MRTREYARADRPILGPCLDSSCPIHRHRRRRDVGHAGNRAKDTIPGSCGGPPQGWAPGYRLNWGRAPGRPDISYPGRRVAIFVHGCFWHHCLRCHPNLPKSNPEFWARKFELNRERDARKQRQLEDADWRVFRDLGSAASAIVSTASSWRSRPL
jgi:DNA mismatch endonuclease Vsr